MWQVFGGILETAMIDGTSKAEAMRIRPNSDIVLRAMRTWFCAYNDPVFTELRLRLYEDQGGNAGKLIATSTNAFTPAEIIVDPTNVAALKGVYFEFPDIALKGTNWYHVLPYATGYTGNDASHLAWVKGWPDNEYRTGLSLTYESSMTNPYRLAVIGADL
jgi:hypothetical protein